MDNKEGNNKQVPAAGGETYLKKEEGVAENKMESSKLEAANVGKKELPIPTEKAGVSKDGPTVQRKQLESAEKKPAEGVNGPPGPQQAKNSLKAVLPDLAGTNKPPKKYKVTVMEGRKKSAGETAQKVTAAGEEKTTIMGSAENDIKAEKNKKLMKDQRGNNQQMKTKEAGKNQDPAQAAEGKTKTNNASKKQGKEDHGSGDGEVKSLKLIGKNEVEDCQNGSKVITKDKAEGGKTGEGSKAEKDSAPEAKKNENNDQTDDQSDDAADEEGEIKELEELGQRARREGLLENQGRLPLLPHPPLVPMPFPPPFMAPMGFFPPFLSMPPMMPPMVRGRGRNMMLPLPMGGPMVPQHFQIPPYGFVGNPMAMAPHHGKRFGRRRAAGSSEEETDDKELEEAGGRSPPGYSRQHLKRWVKSRRHKHRSHRHGRRHRRHGSSSRRNKRRHEYTSSSEEKTRERSRSISSSSSGGRSSSDEDESQKRKKKKDRRTGRSSSSEEEQDRNANGREAGKRRSESPDGPSSRTKKAKGDSPQGGSKVGDPSPGEASRS